MRTRLDENDFWHYKGFYRENNLKHFATQFSQKYLRKKSGSLVSHTSTYTWDQQKCKLEQTISKFWASHNFLAPVRLIRVVTVQV